MSVEIERFSDSGFVPAWVREEHEERFRFAARFVKGLRVVDCACGAGGGARRCAEAGAARVVALDASYVAVSQASRGAPRGVRAFLTAQADARRLPLPPRSADVFVCLETIEHLSEDRALLREVVRVLAPGGLFICSTPDRTVTNPGAAAADAPFNRHHLREYSRAEFESLLGEHFASVEVHGQNPSARGWIELLARLGRRTSPLVPARIRQALKLPGLAWRRPGAHAVREADPGQLWEYLVAVCRLPR